MTAKDSQLTNPESEAVRIQAELRKFKVHNFGAVFNTQEEVEEEEEEEVEVVEEVEKG